MFTNPRPPAHELTRYYTPNYWGVAFSKPDLERLKLGGLPWRDTMHQRAAGILKHLEKGRILEVGCGDGMFLHFMREKGWKVEGVEPGDTPARYASEILGIKVLHGPFEDFPQREGAFDVVYFHHSFEHVERPSDVLRRAASIVRAGGLVAVMLPNFNSFDRRVFGGFWRGLALPIHLHHFTVGRLSALFRDAELEPISVEYFSNSGRWPSNYTDSLRNFLRQKGLYRRGTAPAPQAAESTAAPDGRDMFSSGNRLIDLLHKVEYGIFRNWGSLMDRLGMGSSFLLLGRKSPQTN